MAQQEFTLLKWHFTYMTLRGAYQVPQVVTISSVGKGDGIMQAQKKCISINYLKHRVILY